MSMQGHTTKSPSIPPTPQVSVVVPTFGRSRFLAEAIQSALTQTMGDLELIVSDDASPSEYAKAIVMELNDPRVRIRRNTVNLGQAGNNRSAFAECRGRFVTNLHDDDTWEPTFLERLIQPLINNPDVAVAFCDHWIVDESGRPCVAESNANSVRWGRATLARGRHQPFLDLAVIQQAIPMAMAAVWRRSAVPWHELPNDVNAAYDLYLAYLAARDGAAAWYIAERLTRYRVHPASVTAARSATFAKSQAIARSRMLSDSRLEAIRPWLRRTAGESNTSAGLDLLGMARRQDARQALWAGLRHRRSMRAVAGLILSFAPTVVSAAVVRRLRS